MGAATIKKGNIKLLDKALKRDPAKVAVLLSFCVPIRKAIGFFNF